MKCAHTPDKREVNVVISSSPYLGSLAWRLAGGLLTLSDLARVYADMVEECSRCSGPLHPPGRSGTCDDCEGWLKRVS